jgi:ketosteroid isomerase-like protein
MNGVPVGSTILKPEGHQSVGKTLRLVLVIYVLAAPLRSAAYDATAEIRSVLDGQVAAWNRGDVARFMEGYWQSSKTEFVSSSGVLRGWDTVLERYRRAYPDRQAMGQLTFSDLRITILCPDTALILGYWRLRREHDQPHGVFTLIARKLPEGWRIVNDHTSKFDGP